MPRLEHRGSGARFGTFSKGRGSFGAYVACQIPTRLFVGGTGTDVGKTMISAILMAGTRGLYWKPVQSGLEHLTDTQMFNYSAGWRR